MSADRTVRFLSALSGASTNRVLNLYYIAADYAGNSEYHEKPLFLSPVINRSFLLKHRTRSDETYLFACPKAVVTNVLIPFDMTDLRRRPLAVRGPARLLRHPARSRHGPHRETGARHAGTAPAQYGAEP